VRDEPEKPNQAQSGGDDVNWSADNLVSKVKDFWVWGKKVAEAYGNERQQQQQQQVGDSEPSQAKQQQAASTQGGEAPTGSQEPPKSAFGLDFEDFDDDIEHHHHMASSQVVTEEEEAVVKLSDLKKLGNVSLFIAQDSSLKEQRFIAVGDSFLMCMKSHSSMPGYGHIFWKRSLRHVLRLAYDKSNNKLVSLVLKGSRAQVLTVPEVTNESFTEQFLVEKWREFTTVVRDNTVKLKQQKQPSQ